MMPRTTKAHHRQQGWQRLKKCRMFLFFSFTYFVFTKCFRITAKMMNGHHHHYTPSQFPEWTRAQDTFMSWVPLCFYLFIYLLSNDLSLDCVYRTATRMTNRDSRCRWCVSNPCDLFFFFSSFFCYFIVIGSTYLDASDHHHYPWQQQQYQGLETQQCVSSLWYVFFFFFSICFFLLYYHSFNLLWCIQAPPLPPSKTTAATGTRDATMHLRSFGMFFFFSFSLIHFFLFCYSFNLP